MSPQALHEALSHAPSWAVVSQAQTPLFQRLLEQLAAELGPCRFVTGEVFPQAGASLQIEVGPPYRRSGIVSRIRSWLAFTIFAIGRLWRLPRGTFCLITTNPPLLEPLCWLLCRARRLRIGLLIWDIYPDHVVAGGYAGRRDPIVAIWARLNQASLRCAEVLITIGDAMARRLGAQLGTDGVPLREIEVIPSWADTDLIRPLEKSRNEFAIKHGQVGKLTVIYSGNLGKAHSLKILPEVARRMRDLQHLSFLVIGGGAGFEELKGEATRHRPENLLLLPWQPWEALPLSLPCGDIALVSQAASIRDLSVPSKTYNLLAAGCAVVALTDANSDLAALVEREGVGLICPVDDADSLECALRRLAGNPDLLRSCRQRARQAAEERYSVDAAVSRFKAVLASSVTG